MTVAHTGTMSGGMAYSAFGDGPPVVFIRPVMPSSGNPDGLTRWAERRPLAPLAAHHTMYCLSRPAGLKPGISMADLATHYAVAIGDHFGEPTDVIGLSTSGSLALQLALDHPGVVRRLVVVAAACRFGG